MKSISKILKKNNRQCLGKYNRELVIRLVMKRHKMMKPVYHLVLTRRRNTANSRYDKLGYYENFKSPSHQKQFHILGIDRKKFKNALALGASLHTSVYKLLFH